MCSQITGKHSGSRKEKSHRLLVHFGAQPRPGSIFLDQFAPLIASSASSCSRRRRLQPPHPEVFNVSSPYPQQTLSAPFSCAVQVPPLQASLWFNTPAAVFVFCSARTLSPSRLHFTDTQLLLHRLSLCSSTPLSAAACSSCPWLCIVSLDLKSLLQQPLCDATLSPILKLHSPNNILLIALGNSHLTLFFFLLWCVVVWSR